MIMPCMNRTSAGDRGGRVALVEGGNLRVGWPGAPGCTTTGAEGLVCCAQTRTDNEPASMPTSRSNPRQIDILINEKVLIDVLSPSYFRNAPYLHRWGGTLWPPGL